MPTPDAKIPTAGGFISARTFSEVPTPRVGDKILLFVLFEPADPNHRILVVNTWEQVVVVRGGRVFAPAGACSSTEAVPNPYSTVDALDVAIRANAHLHDVPKR